jgi:biopolymer transport protein ExbD
VGLYSKRKLRPVEEEHQGELNIVPYLDVLMNLIMFMLLSITGLLTFGAVNVNAPNYGGASAQVSPEDPSKPKLLLTVLIAKKGFFIAGTGAVLGQGGASDQPQQGTDGSPTVALLGDGSYNYSGLTEEIVKVKKAFPDETKIIIGGESDVAYETLVETMDAVRETQAHAVLFPDVTLAAM